MNNPATEKLIGDPSPLATTAPPAASDVAAKAGADPFFSGRRHFPELDGLRGLAILMVMAFHYRGLIALKDFAIGRIADSVLAYGWVGVDLFFVLSGFLITGILADSKGQQNYFRNFYMRRFLRIFPVYYGLLFGLLLSLSLAKFASPHFWATHQMPHEVWRSQIYLWTYTTNLAIAFTHAQFPYLAHLWSLSVEEQFYLLWPLVIFLLPRRWLVGGSVALIGLAIASRILAVRAGCSGSQIYFITPCRMDEFGAGALLALIIRRRGLALDTLARMATVVLPAAGIVWVLLTATAGKSHPVFNDTAKIFAFSLLSLVFVSLLAITLSSKAIWGLPHRLFSWRPLRAAGKYSYAAYILHIPVMGLWSLIPFHTAFGRRYSGNLLLQSAMLLGCVITTFALAYASYHLYEKHFLKLKKYFPERAAAC